MLQLRLQLGDLLTGFPPGGPLCRSQRNLQILDAAVRSGGGCFSRVTFAAPCVEFLSGVGSGIRALRPAA